MNTVLSCISVLLFLSLLGLGDSLECYNCQIIETLTKDNPCQRPTQCNGPAVCLSASFSLENERDGQKVSATLKSCIPKSDGNECDRIAALDNLLKVPGFKTDFGGGCYTCEKDGCNHASGPAKASLTMLAVISLFSLLWCFSNKS